MSDNVSELQFLTKMQMLKKKKILLNVVPLVTVMKTGVRPYVVSSDIECMQQQTQRAVIHASVQVSQKIFTFSFTTDSLTES